MRRFPIIFGIVIAAFGSFPGCSSQKRPSNLPSAAVLPSASPIAVAKVTGKEIDSTPVKLASATGPAAEESQTNTTPPEVLPAPNPRVVDLGSTENTYPIDLTTALRLADSSNSQIAVAREQIRLAWAKANYAQTLWLPSIRVGADFNKHEGAIQNIQGQVFNVSRANLYTGLGAGVAAAGSAAAPGLYMNFHLADALFNPLAAQQLAHARQCAAEAATNDTLLKTAIAYLELLKAAEELGIAREASDNAQQLATLTASYAESGQGLRSDADRAETESAIRQNDVLRAEEGLRVATARLAQLLRLDPTLVLAPLEPTVPTLELVAYDEAVGELISRGLSCRPELSESRFLVGQAVQKMKRERYAALVPSVVLGVSYGGFGGNQGDTIANFSNRMDADAIAFWELRNLGFGDRYAREEAGSLLQQANLNQVAMMDQVAREVTEAAAQVSMRHEQIPIAQRAVESATKSHTRNLDRIREAQGLPIEVLQSNQALAQARREYLRTLIDYNTAQLTLHRAIGAPSQSTNISVSEFAN